MKIKKRLKICRAQRERLAILCVDHSREIAQLTAKVAELEQESFTMFCKYKVQADKNTDLKNQIAASNPLEPLPLRPWWKALLP